MSAKRVSPTTAPNTSPRSLCIIWQAFESHAPLKNILLYVSEHPGQAISLAEAASIAAMGRTYFAEYFHQHTGVTFKYWRDFLRVQHAITLFRFSNIGILEIAQECGFYDATTFTRTFRRVMGRTPTQYRRDLPKAPERAAEPTVKDLMSHR